MALTEIFVKPTVKKVIFQIQFPNLFFIESKIGELQIAIMEKFPESALIFQRQIVFTDINPGVNLEELQDKVAQGQSRKIWQFNSPLGYQLNVLTDSIDINSNLHKTYNNEKSDVKFRDIIEYVLKPFFLITKLPVISRLGLRYIDECSFFAKTTESFLRHFNSCFSTNRFSIEDSTEHQYKVIVKRGNHFIRYVETLNSQSNPPILILDFDGFALNVPTDRYMETSDDLHVLISNEYELTIKEPIYKYMRGE